MGRFLGSNRILVAVVGAVSVVWVVGAAVAVGLSPLISILLFAGVVAVAVLVGRRLRGAATAEPVSLGTATIAALTGVFVLGAAIQAVPYGRDHSAGPVTGEPPWDSKRTEVLTRAACFDCHSNETRYPWYAHVAPFSWAVQRHVTAGREAVNFSEWDRPQPEAHESAETVEEGSMPPRYYVLSNRQARLSEAEEAELVAGLEATFGSEDDERRDTDDEGDDE